MCSTNLIYNSPYTPPRATSYLPCLLRSSGSQLRKRKAVIWHSQLNKHVGFKTTSMSLLVTWGYAWNYSQQKVNLKDHSTSELINAIEGKKGVNCDIWIFLWIFKEIKRQLIHPQKKHMEPKNHPIKRENNLPNLQSWVPSWFLGSRYVHGNLNLVVAPKSEPATPEYHWIK